MEQRAPRDARPSIALFSEPIRGTDTLGDPVMILGLMVDGEAEAVIFGVSPGGRPAWWPFCEISFDWRWSPELGRWADLEELVNPDAR
jgi:hypothetical protein